MALASYQTQVQFLLHDPNAQFFPLATLTTAINQARYQIATEGECIRGTAPFSTSNGTELYATVAFSGPATPIGIANGPLVIRSLSYGGLTLEARNWDYFNFYFRNIAKPANGPPKAWCPFMQGTQGSFYIAPVPDATYSVSMDAVWLPGGLADDANPEALTYPWTDAVQFYAAYLCLKDSQRTADAERMFALYETYMERARGGVTPLVTSSAHPGGMMARSPIPGMAPPTRAVEAQQR